MVTWAKVPLPNQASVVIVGGGVVGVSAAFHLAEAGVRDVVLVERAEFGSGSTGRGAGGVRAQFSDVLNIQIAQRSLAAFSAFARRPGWEIDFKQVGYLFVLTQEQDVSAFERSVKLQNEYGVPSRMLSAREAKQLCPLLEVGDVLAAAFSPEDGYATPDAVVQGYAGAARRHGAHLETSCEVLEIRTRGAEINEVVTSRGVIRTDAVICAAGVWSRACAAMVGVDLPVTPLRRQILFTEPLVALPQQLPMTIDFETSFYFHREGPGLLFGMSDQTEVPGFNMETTDDWIPALMDIAERRAPAVATAGIKGGWAGLYDMSPDNNALIGEVNSISRFLYATGFSGHGFLQGPAVGEILRDLYLRREPFVDVSPLTMERFSDDRQRPEFHVI